MKRASKILTLILIVVFVLSVFAGCDLVGRDIAKYRSTVAMTVGNQEITVGKLLDTFNSYYNNYYYYISAGYIDAEGLLEMALNALMQQYIQIDDYVTKHASDPARKGIEPEVKNAEFLTKEQFEYCIKYVKHTSFTTFDGTVLTNLSAKHDIGDAKAEDTSRDFPEYEQLKEAKYADYMLKQNFMSEDADEYFEKYYGNGVDFTKLENLATDYVYKTEAAAKTILDELNERLEDESDEITFDEYVEAQQKAIEQYRDTIKNNYGVELEKFMEGQVADMVSSCILALWSYEQYQGIDVTTTINEANKTLAAAQEAEFAISGNFNSFITGLNDSSFIYGVPSDMMGKYVFVKNILIPFTDEQAARLSEQAKSYGGTDNEAYKKIRNETAERIAAEYFYSDKYEQGIEDLFKNFLTENTDEDSDSKYEKIENIFKAENGKVAINTGANGVLGQFFGANGEVKEMDGKTKSETIVELMKRFNTDVGQHSTRYDYVVYVGDDWEDYSHSWVKEFYTAVNELERNSDGSFAASNKGKYAMCVSTYGVHIIFVEGFVEEEMYKFGDVDWTKAWQDTSTLDYVRYKAEFENRVNLLTQEKFQALEATYLDGKVTVNRQFKRFLKDNGFEFDFDEFVEEIKEELPAA